MIIKNTLPMTTLPSLPRNTSSPQRTLTRLWLFLATLCLIVTGLPAYAVNRDITITAPTTVIAGSKITITVGARSDAGGGEKIGFFHADYSVDSGLTWTAISYATNAGPKAMYSATFVVKEANSKAMVRVRVAYRGGKAGDVDYTGKPIAWEGSWSKWQEPPAKIVSIAVVGK